VRPELGYEYESFITSSFSVMGSQHCVYVEYVSSNCQEFGGKGVSRGCGIDCCMFGPWSGIRVPSGRCKANRGASGMTCSAATSLSSPELKGPSCPISECSPVNVLFSSLQNLVLLQFLCRRFDSFVSLASSTLLACPSLAINDVSNSASCWNVSARANSIALM
jgi:hypothetical protein